MAERKAVNKYYPPDWDPSKGSINTYVGQHPLRERAKKLSQGILVIRFEMPYNIWCGGCNSHIGMGVRYNAEKSKTGKYYTTPIYKFRMKCHLCSNYFEIQTDPKNHDYVILSGARRKEQRWDPKENGQIVPEDKATQKKLATDSMYKLEHGSDDKHKGKSIKTSLAYVELERQEWKDDYLLNKALRAKFRGEKKAINDSISKDNELLKKSSLEIDLVEEDETDIRLASLLKYSVTESYVEKQRMKRKQISSRSIFEGKPPKLRVVNKPLSRPFEIRQKLGLSSSTNSFDADSVPSSVTALVPSIRTSLGIKQKSEEPSLANDTARICENKCDVGTPSSLSDGTEVAASNVEMVCTNGTSIVNNNSSQTCVSDSQNALAALIGNYSDSEGDT